MKRPVFPSMSLHPFALTVTSLVVMCVATLRPLILCLWYEAPCGKRSPHASGRLCSSYRVLFYSARMVGCCRGPWRGTRGIVSCCHLNQLAYPHQRGTWDDRAARRTDGIRERLGWQSGILNDRGWKPNGMHWNTLERPTAQRDTLVQISRAGVAARLNLSGKSLDDWI